MRYVIHTKNRLLYGATEALQGLKVYVDADWAGDQDTRKSMNGFGALMSGSLVS